MDKIRSLPIRNLFFHLMMTVASFHLYMPLFFHLMYQKNITAAAISISEHSKNNSKYNTKNTSHVKRKPSPP